MIFESRWKNSTFRKVGGRVLIELCRVDHFFSGKGDCTIGSTTRIDAQKKKIAIYVTYPDLNDDESEKFLFKALEKCGYEVLIVANSLGVKSPPIWMRRKNRGFDLAAIRDSLDYLDGRPETLLVLNSSIIWLEGVSEFLVFCEKVLHEATAGVLSLTQSFQRSEHAQSFFFMVPATEYPFFVEAYGKMKNWRTKRAAVNYGEIKLSRYLRRSGVQIRFIFPYSSVYEKAATVNERLRLNSSRKEMRFNPSHHFASEIISMGGPFYKRNLKFNPQNNV
jgi:hypothetical protein